jgi:hypothetical protein
VIRHEWRNDQVLLTTSERYQWSFVTQIFRTYGIFKLYCILK